MPSVTLVISDTPEGGLSIWNDLVPAPGKRCSLAEQAALDIISRTRREYGLPVPTPNATRPVKPLPSEPITCSADARQ